MKFRAAILCLSLLAATSPSFSATPPKAGATCAKVGISQNYLGKKYICIKSGKKLVWDIGVVMATPAPKLSPTPKTSPSVSPSPTLMPNSVSSLALDSRITSSNLLNSMETCQTIDQTPDMNLAGIQMGKQGFPRPSGTVYGKSSARVLVIPLSFKDLPFTTGKPSTPLGMLSDLDLLKELIKASAEGYSKLSAGRFKLNVDILPQEKWWKMDYPIKFTSTRGIDNVDEMMKIISENSPDIFSENYDTYFFVTSQGAALGYSTPAQAWFQQPVKVAPSGFANLALVSGGLNDAATFMHELGHTLFGFEDLYPFGEPGWKIPGASFPQNWDLMAGTSLSFLNWDKFLMGWLKSNEVRCLTNQLSTTHYLSTFENSNQVKVLFINLTQGVTLAAEIRNEGNFQKLLVYVINSYIGHGSVPILTFDKLLGSGQYIDLFGWRIEVLETDSSGALIQTTKTDIDKFVIPKTSQSTSGNSNPVMPSTISVAKKEIVPTGTSTAKLSLEVSGQQSYRVYATAPDDPQKVYFESGYIANNSKNIEVGITGLTCSKDSRVMVELSTFPDGKGETLVIELTLKAWKC